MSSEPAAVTRRWPALLAMRGDLVVPFLGQHLDRLHRLVELLGPGTGGEPLADIPDEQMRAVELIVTGWDTPALRATDLARMPRLRAIVHTGGSVKAILCPEVWERGIAVSSQHRINAIPVAEYTLAMVLLATRRALDIGARFRRRRGPVDLLREYPELGTPGATLGIVGASAIGTRVLELVRPHGLEVVVYDPYADPSTITTRGARPASLPEVMRSRIVSLHAPATEESRHMIGASELALMPEGGTLINTARGSLLDHDALLPHVRSGRLNAVLDVTDPLPLPPEHPFYDLDNVILTPHLAGSQGVELSRLGEHAVNEVERLVTGAPLAHPVHAALLATTA
jgi:phosphoglycerate dehydrogenase-like enzyme